MKGTLCRPLLGLLRRGPTKLVLRPGQVKELPGPRGTQLGSIPLATVSPSPGPPSISDTWIFQAVKLLRI